MAPYYSTAFCGLSMHLINMGVFRRTRPNFLQIGAAGLLGYSIACMGLYNMDTVLYRKFDHDLMEAAEKRYMHRAMSSAGYATRYISIYNNDGHQ